MSMNLKNTATAAGLVVASAFSANASVLDHNPGFDEGMANIIRDCIAENPQGPEACIRAEVVELTSNKIKAIEEHVANQPIDPVLGDSTAPLNTMKCVLNTAPDLITDHYKVMLNISDNGISSVLAGDEQEFSALKDFMKASTNTLNACLDQHMPGLPGQDVNEVLNNMDQAREMMLAPQ